MPKSNAVSYAFAIMAPVLIGLCAWLGWDWRLAVLAGAAAGVAIVASFHRYPVPASRETPEEAAVPLPPAYWCYLVALGMSVAVEFSILLWAPAYLEKVLGLTASWAAIGTAAFFAGMLIGRVIGTALFHVVSIRRLFFATSALTLAGFALYWGVSDPRIAIVGLFVVGLGVASLFPLVLSFAIAAAGPAADRGSARVMLAPGLAVLTAPPLLGAIADVSGLATAQLMTPVFMGLGVLAYIAGSFAERIPAGLPAGR